MNELLNQMVERATSLTNKLTVDMPTNEAKELSYTLQSLTSAISMLSNTIKQGGN